MNEKKILTSYLIKQINYFRQQLSLHPALKSVPQITKHLVCGHGLFVLNIVRIVLINTYICTSISIDLTSFSRVTIDDRNVEKVPELCVCSSPFEL